MATLQLRVRQCWSAIFLVAAACEQQTDRSTASNAGSTAWKSSYTPAECKALLARDAYWKRCFNAEPNVPVEHLVEANYVGDLNCLPHTPPQRMSGVWLVDLESSAFFPNASSYRETETGGRGMWLQVKPLPTSEVGDAMQGAGTRAYAVELIGRRSLCEYNYGWGVWPNQVVAERILMMRALPVPAR